MDDNRFDNVLMGIIQQQKGIDPFFDTLFGFLRRNTDFFADQKKAQTSIVQSCKRNFQKYTQEVTKKKNEQEKKLLRQEKRKQQLVKQKQKQQPQQIPVPEKAKDNQVSQVKDEQYILTSQKVQQKDQKAPIGNGGRTENYFWTQTLQQLHINVPISNDVQKKQVYVKFDSQNIKVIVRGQQLINGKFTEKIHADGSIWTIESGQFQTYKGKYISFALEKWKNQWHWWASAIKGDPEIDTKKINPESSNLSDLDGQTRSTVQKMMQDMRRKQMGLPSTQDQKKNDMLKKFMKEHPQMDFSKCKFN